MQYEKLEASEKTAAPPAYTAVVAAPQEPRREWFLVKKFLCCLELATGVVTYGVLDFLASATGFMLFAFVVFAQTHKVAVEEKGEEPTTTTEYSYSNSTTAFVDVTSVDTAVEYVNFHLSTKNLVTVLVLLGAFSAATFVWGVVACHATSKGKCALKAARHYYFYKLAVFVVSLFSNGLLHTLFHAYAALVCRSHYVQLRNEKQSSLPTLVGVVAPPTPDHPELVKNPLHDDAKVVVVTPTTSSS